MKSIILSVGEEHECSYLPERMARMAWVPPEYEPSSSLYSQLATHGFRRSGDWLYRPNCPQCSACRSIRIDVARFRPNRSQRRTLKLNHDIDVMIRPAHLTRDHYRLYRSYLGMRHPESAKELATQEETGRFLGGRGWLETLFIEFYRGKRLLGVSVVDRLDDGYSAVYTFFEPEESARSLGTLAILWLLGEARRKGITWVYLGYWIAECPKMRYKERFRPAEIWSPSGWCSLHVPLPE